MNAKIAARIILTLAAILQILAHTLLGQIILVALGMAALYGLYVTALWTIDVWIPVLRRHLKTR